MFFKEQIKKRIKNEKGLTLIELLAVIVILAIIAAIAIPAIGNIIQNSRDKSALSESLNIISGAKIAMMDNACASKTECNGKELESFVDGIELADTDIVKLVSNEYYIQYSKIDAIDTNSKFKPSKVDKQGYKEADIKEKLDKKD